MIRLTVCALALSAAACGDNLVGALPEGYLEAQSGGADAGLSYPAGPYGTEPGATMADMQLEGYLRVEPGAAASYQPLSIAALREADADARYLLLNVAAEWCTGCRTEAETLAARAVAWSEKGGAVLSVLVQDASGGAAGKGNLEGWASQYNTNYSFVADPQALIAQRFGVDVLPLNLIVRLDTMEILQKSVGDNLAFLDGYTELLEKL